MKQLSLALAWIAGCAILTPAAMAGTPPVQPPRPAVAAQKRRQLIVQHTHIGFQKYAQRDLGWAARHFKEALRLEPKNAALHATLGGVYGSRGSSRMRKSNCAPPRGWSRGTPSTRSGSVSCSNGKIAPLPPPRSIRT